jgi:hypothetical protein
MERKRDGQPLAGMSLPRGLMRPPRLWRGFDRLVLNSTALQSRGQSGNSTFEGLGA